MMDAAYILSNINFAGDEWKFAVPVALMAIDFLTGIVNAWATGHLKSYRMREGLVKKFGEICILVIAVLFIVGLGMPPYIFSGLSVYIIFMELISICENLIKMGVPIPKFLMKAFNSLDKVQNSQLSDEELSTIIKSLKKKE